MYSVLLVDDEKRIREGVCELLNMTNLDLDITMAASAIDAIAILESRKIDIAIMDINMPQMSGLELYDITRERWPYCKMIFLTGYSEFDYVYRVHHHARYVLKAEDDQKIIDAVTESIDEIEKDMLLERVNHSNALPDLGRRYFERKLLFKELIENTNIGRTQMHGILESADLNLDLNKDVFSVMIRCCALQTMDYNESNAARNGILTLLDRYFMKVFRCEYFGYNHSILYLMLQPRKETSREKAVTQLTGITELVQKAIYKNLAIPLSALIRDHPVSAETAVGDFSVLSDRMLGMESDEICVSDLSSGVDGENAVLTETIKKDLSRKITQMESQFDNMDREGILELLEELRTIFRTINNKNDLFAMEIYCAVSSKLLSYIQRVGIQEEAMQKLGSFNFMNFSQMSSWADAFSGLKRVAGYVFNQVDSSIDSKNEDVVNKVKYYIRHHLDGDTSLYALASYVHLCPEHLLRIFKKQENVTVLQYINDVKLAKAKQMLSETDMQIKEIASELGFTSSGYFGRFFKLKTGITPNVYRDQKTK